VTEYARYRAPSESGQKLIAPPWGELCRTVAGNVAWRAARMMVMKEDVKSMLRQGQSKDFSQSMCRAGDEGKRGHAGIVIG